MSKPAVSRSSPASLWAFATAAGVSLPSISVTASVPGAVWSATTYAAWLA